MKIVLRKIEYWVFVWLVVVSFFIFLNKKKFGDEKILR